MVRPTKIGACPLTTVQRLPEYLRLLRRLSGEGRASVSSACLGGLLKLEAIQVRKDFGCIGIVGRPRAGFAIPPAIEKIERCLNWDNLTEAILVGAGHLGTALLGFAGFAAHGLSIVAAFDSGARLRGRELNGKPVYGMEELAGVVRERKIRIAILTVPPEAAQQVAELLVAAGIQGIWNFTGRKITVPTDIIVQNQDISTGLAVLSARLAERQGNG